MEVERYLGPGEPGRCWLRSERLRSGGRRFDPAPRRLVELVALHVVSGRIRYLVDQRVLTLGAGSLLWAHADQWHLLLSESRDADCWVFVLAPRLLASAVQLPPIAARSVEGESGARLLAPAIHDELQTIASGLMATTDPALLSVGLQWWAARAWAAWRESRRMAGARVHPAVRRSLELLREDPDLPLAVVAKEAGLSLSQLHRAFRAGAGQSLGTYRTGRRLELVDHAMAGDDAPPLLDAAFDAGFGSYSQFFRVFRAARGVSPRAYYRS